MPVRVKNLDRVFSKIFTVLKLTRNEDLMREMGAFSKDRIFKMTKSGKSIFWPAAKAINGLKEVTKKIRKSWAGKGNQVGSYFSPNRSNLTMTGQMLDALKYKYTRGSNKVNIFIEDSSRPVKGPVLRGKKPENLTNAQVARRVAANGRPFMGMDDLGKRRLIQLAKRKLRDEIKKEFK